MGLVILKVLVVLALFGSSINSSLAATGLLLQKPIFGSNELQKVNSDDPKSTPNRTVYNIGYRSRAVIQTEGGKIYFYLFGNLECSKKDSRDCLSTIDLPTLLKETIEKNPDKSVSVVLNLDGGQLSPAYKIRDIIKENLKRGRHIETYLPPGGVCTSACVPVFTATPQRFAASSARFGFHDCTDELGPSQKLTNEYKQKLREDGVSEQSLSRAFPTPSDAVVIKADDPAIKSLISEINDNVIPRNVLLSFKSGQGRVPHWGDLQIPPQGPANISKPAIAEP